MIDIQKEIPINAYSVTIPLPTMTKIVSKIATNAKYAINTGALT